MQVQTMNEFGTIMMYNQSKLFEKNHSKYRKFCVGIQFPIDDFLIFLELS